MTRAGRWSSLVEALGVFALIMLYIWWLRLEYPWLWTVLLGFVLGTHFTHGENPRMLGFGLAGFGEAARRVLPVVAALAAMLLAAGALFGTVRDIDAGRAAVSLAAYVLWGLFQQYLLNAFFVNRLAEFSGDAKGRAVPLAAAALFAMAHLPNWFLIAATFAGGYACARLYLDYRNLYVLGLAHGVVGFLLYLVVPDSISAHFLIGPRYILEVYGTYPEALL